MAIVSDERNEELKRKLAEAVLCGEYDAAVVLLVTQDGVRKFWADGQLATTVGLCELAKLAIVASDQAAENREE